MKFLCLTYYDPEIANNLSPDEAQELSDVCGPHYEAWQKTGKLVAMSGLSDPRAWKTIRPSDTSENAGGQPIVEAGPYLSSSRRIGAFFIVEAPDIDEAVAIATKHPSAHTGRFLGGGIEVCVCEGFELLDTSTNGF